jgi:hypothetical protein
VDAKQQNSLVLFTYVCALPRVLTWGSALGLKCVIPPGTRLLETSGDFVQVTVNERTVSRPQRRCSFDYNKCQGSIAACTSKGDM